MPDHISLKKVDPIECSASWHRLEFPCQSIRDRSSRLLEAIQRHVGINEIVIVVVAISRKVLFLQQCLQRLPVLPHEKVIIAKVIEGQRILGVGLCPQLVVFVGSQQVSANHFVVGANDAKSFLGAHPVPQRIGRSMLSLARVDSAMSQYSTPSARCAIAKFGSS